jgi:hypothetical protein
VPYAPPRDQPKVIASRVRLSLAVLITANAVPVFGVLFLHWDVFGLLLLFWVENVYVGVFGLLRILTARKNTGFLRRLFLPPFFLVHYSGFVLAHGFMLLLVFSPEPPTREALMGSHFYLELFMGRYRGLAVIALFISHLFSFIVNYVIGREYQHMSAAQAMRVPYARIVIMQVSLLVGGYMLQKQGEPFFGLAVLVGLKIILDLILHAREHGRLAGEYEPVPG